jgi:hypothetical protein
MRKFPDTSFFVVVVLYLLIAFVIIVFFDFSAIMINILVHPDIIVRRMLVDEIFAHDSSTFTDIAELRYIFSNIISENVVIRGVLNLIHLFLA